MTRIKQRIKGKETNEKGQTFQVRNEKTKTKKA